MPKERIWTPAARQFLFERIKEKFGPGRDWESTNKPGRGKDPAFDKFCDQFARVVGATSGEAVKIQIRFGMPTAGRPTWKSGQTQVAILCLAAAFQAGFIADRDLPDLKAMPRKAS